MNDFRRIKNIQFGKQVIKKINLEIKRSRIPGSGKGLFTHGFIPAGTNIVEYTGKIIKWTTLIFFT
jgi:hypothetical protein